MDAKEIIRKEYGRRRNFMTSYITSYGKIRGENHKGFSEIAYEISSGKSFSGGPLYGLSVVSYDPETGETKRERDLSTCFRSLKLLNKYIVELQEKMKK